MFIYTRQATLADLDDLMRIYNHAITFLAEQGSPQWQDGDGPTRDEITKKIATGQVQTLIYNGQVAGVGILVAGPEDAYESLDGDWLPASQPTYVGIHRVAVDLDIRGKGLSKVLLHDLIVLARAQGYQDIRIDTYPKNAIMQKVIGNAGFTRTGMIDLGGENGDRIAYQLLLD